MAGKLIDPEIRFWRYVNKTDSCWLWTGSMYRNGYGRFTFTDKPFSYKQVLAHRYSYKLCVRELSSKEDLDHLCHNQDKACLGGWSCLHRKCVRPDHLEPTTRRKNLERGRTIIADQLQRTHCPKGHPYSIENTIHEKNHNGSCRRCKICRRAQNNHRKPKSII